MKLTADQIKLIFGLKLRQLRNEKGYSLAELSKRSGISISYLNELEKGKKYPTPQKIHALAEALGVSYDRLVSTKLDKQLAPVTEVLQSGILNDLPLEWFGINQAMIVELIANAPAKVTAFISTLMEIARNYDMQQEHFYFAALRTYQELHENYFEDIEEKVEEFVHEYDIYVAPPVGVERLYKILTQRFHVVVDEEELAKYPELKSFRSLFIPGHPDVLLINPELTHNQKAFVFGRELAFKFLGLEERPYTFSWLKVKSFDQVLNNFKASYFANALLINRQHLTNDLTDFFHSRVFDQEKLRYLIYRYNASPEMFVHRLSNILPKHFGINRFFFQRFHNKPGSNAYFLTKEMSLLGNQGPHAIQGNEHYCKRWVSLRILDDLIQTEQGNGYSIPLIKAQRMLFLPDKNEYFCISIARPMLPTPDTNCSVSLGFLVNQEFKKVVNFWEDPAVPFQYTGLSCERCDIEQCQERVAEPVIIKKQQEIKQMSSIIKKLVKKYSGNVDPARLV